MNVEESNDDYVVFVSKDNLKPITSVQTYSFLEFKRQNHDLYYQNSNSPELANKQSISPKIRPKYLPRCGNEYTGRGNKIKSKRGIDSRLKKSTWNVYIKG